MRKLVVVFAVLIFSCSSSDGNLTKEDKLVGKWKLVKEVIVCKSGEEDVYTYGSCGQKTIFTFNSNETMSYIGYDLDDRSGNCIEEESFSGTWSINQDIIEMKINGVRGSFSFFEVSNNELKLGQYETDNIPCNQSTISHEYKEYSKQ